MNKDTFFTQERCDRCGKTPLSIRIMSFFTEETICIDCSNIETEIRHSLPDNGRDYEGIGCVPELE